MTAATPQPTWPCRWTRSPGIPRDGGRAPRHQDPATPVNRTCHTPKEHEVELKACHPDRESPRHQLHRRRVRQPIHPGEDPARMIVSLVRFPPRGPHQLAFARRRPDLAPHRRDRPGRHPATAPSSACVRRHRLHPARRGTLARRRRRQLHVPPGHARRHQRRRRHTWLESVTDTQYKPLTNSRSPGTAGLPTPACTAAPGVRQPGGRW